MDVMIESRGKPPGADISGFGETGGLRTQSQGTGPADVAVAPIRLTAP